ncbi:7762_t:CDS:2, partial [Ambispora gerdemannii]
MSTSKYLGYDVLISYLNERENQSYRGFLDLHRNVIVASLVSDDWHDLDNNWADHFLREAEVLLDRKTFVALKEKNLLEGVIEERGSNSAKRKRAQFSEGISLSAIIRNTLPNLVYLQLRHNKSKSSTISIEQRFPDEIANWVGFKEEVRTWQSECVDKKYKKPMFGPRTITCEKDIWTASEINIHDILTPLDRSICFLDGRALEGTDGQPDFIVVDENYQIIVPFEYKTRWVLKVPSNKNIVALYLREKEIRKGKFTGFKDTSIYDPINQIYGYMCANELRGVKENHGWLHVSDAITNTSTDPTLLKSVAYIIFVASNNRYSPFLEKPVMVAVE